MVKIKLSLPIGEIEIDSPEQTIQDAVDAFPSLLQKLRIKISEQPTLEDLKIEQYDSLTKIIIKLFSNEWGQGCRRLTDVRALLESYAQHYPKASVAVTLMRLAQRGKLRRFKKKVVEYVYTTNNLLFNKELETREQEHKEPEIHTGDIAIVS